MQIRSTSDADRAVWDRYVEEHPGGSPYHLYAWKLAVEEAYPHRGRYRLAEDDRGVHGVLPVFDFRVPLSGARQVSLPFCDVGGPLADTPEVERALVDAVLDDAPGSLTLRAGTALVGLNGRPRRRLAPEKVRMLLELPSTAPELFDAFRAKLRSQIRKAEKNGLTFRRGTLDDVPAAYAVMSRNMRDLGSPVHARDLYAAVLRHYGDLATLGLVCLDQQVIGCGITLRVADRVAIPWASTLRQHNRLAPNMLLYWKLLEAAVEDGARHFDFGRSTEGESTYRFKEQWGARPTPLAWCELGPTVSAGDDDETPGKLRPLVESAWRRLPLPVANFIGPRVRRYVSL